MVITLERQLLSSINLEIAQPCAELTVISLFLAEKISSDHWELLKEGSLMRESRYEIGI